MVRAPLAIAFVLLALCPAIAAPGEGKGQGDGVGQPATLREKVPLPGGHKPDALGIAITTQLSACWKRRVAIMRSEDHYYPTFRLAVNQDGTFARTPQLLNPPANDRDGDIATSGLAALQHCQPLVLPSSLMRGAATPYVRTVRFVD